MEDAMQTEDAFVDDNGVARRIYRNDDAFYIEAKLTEEGVIVDVFNASDQPVGTFAREYGEFIPPDAPQFTELYPGEFRD
jgi:hypothetical protein